MTIARDNSSNVLDSTVTNTPVMSMSISMWQRQDVSCPGECCSPQDYISTANQLPAMYYIRLSVISAEQSLILLSSLLLLSAYLKGLVFIRSHVSVEVFSFSQY